MPDADFDRLSAHVRARTLMSVCHEVWSEPADATPGVPVSVGMVEVAGRPYLVPPLHSGSLGHLTWLAAGMELLCLAMVDDLGMMRMRGTLGAPLRSGQDPEVSRVLRDHRGCLIGAGPLDQIVLFPLELAAISVVPPGGGEHPLDPAAVRAAEPDWLLANEEGLVNHLHESHSVELIELSQTYGVANASVVTVERLTRRGAQLACLTADGVTTVEIAFEPPVDRPAELWRQLSPARPSDPHGR